jgi:hypothetical protein
MFINSLKIINSDIVPNFETTKCLVDFYNFVFCWPCILTKFWVLTKIGTPDSHPPECVIPDDVLIQFGPPDDENLLLETCRGMK